MQKQSEMSEPIVPFDFNIKGILAINLLVISFETSASVGESSEPDV